MRGGLKIAGAKVCDKPGDVIVALPPFFPPVLPGGSHERLSLSLLQNKRSGRQTTLQQHFELSQLSTPPPSP